MYIYVEITEQELKLDRIVDLVRSPSAGAVSTFIGTTRDNHDGRLKNDRARCLLS